ncbi:hypothetical protein [Sphingopyxis terrae]|uniref:hypothetical protein n=1 Tax=Sphingopyxis terrae TaxID=33052 RepID=UPI002A0F83A5|nr:hypothetical protein [Sphingopyxis terrae]MDX8357767.1 hypothetical protein [Sphingopyxis terrae]
MSELFVPNQGYDQCKVFIAEPAGKVTELQPGCLQTYPEFDACLIMGFSAEQRYRLSDNDLGPASECALLGFEANTAPFDVRQVNGVLCLDGVQVERSRQFYHGMVPKKRIFSIDAADIKIDGKHGYICDVSAKVGLSGGPMIDLRDNTAVGLCFMGLPADAHQKNEIGVLDIRQLPFLR